jgi:hypothetical protein
MDGKGAVALAVTLWRQRRRLFEEPICSPIEFDRKVGELD